MQNCVEIHRQKKAETRNFSVLDTTPINYSWGKNENLLENEKRHGMGMLMFLQYWLCSSGDDRWGTSKSKLRTTANHETVGNPILQPRRLHEHANLYPLHEHTNKHDAKLSSVPNTTKTPPRNPTFTPNDKILSKLPDLKTCPTRTKSLQKPSRRTSIMSPIPRSRTISYTY